MKKELPDLQIGGYQCSQIIMSKGLERFGKKNNDLVVAVSGLCGSMLMKDEFCGTLIATNCLILLIEPKETRNEKISLINQWFKETFNHYECKKLSGYDYMAKTNKCPLILEQTFNKLCEMFH